MHPVETASPSGGSLRRCAHPSQESRSTLTGTLPCSRPHPGSQHVTGPHPSTGRMAGSTWLWLKEAKSMLKIAQSGVHFPIFPFASCLQSVSQCFHSTHSTNPIQSSFWFKSLFSYIFTCFNRVNPGYNQVYLYVFRYINSI